MPPDSHENPLPPDNAAELEATALEQVRAAVRETSASSLYDDFELGDVRLRGAFPRTEVEVLFRWSRYEGEHFGRRRLIWEPDGSFSEFEVKDLLMNLMLETQNRRRDLALPAPDGEGIRWI